MVTGVQTPSCQISWKEKRSERRSLEPGSPGTPGNREVIDPSRHQRRERGGRRSQHNAAKYQNHNVFIPLEGCFLSYGHRIKSQVLPIR